ncbi:uncharacterized protein LOC132283820 [Cornus florida]|uniref:uncharacterized protein LOC132283820 n=1 Tax=Cornus florida TaxID=4283 RepID=UPI0028991719|nr:uncharacterized protein LOC132283820 [Cornus florida]
MAYEIRAHTHTHIPRPLMSNEVSVTFRVSNHQPQMAEVSNLHVFHRPIVVQQQESEQHQQQQSHIKTLDFIQNNNEDDDDDEPFGFNCDPLSSPSLSFFVPSFSHPHNSNSYDSDSDSDFESGYSDPAPDPNCFYGDDQMDFVTDLFESREEHVADDSGSVSDSFLDTNFRVFGENCEYDSTYEEDLGLGFGSRIEFDTLAFASQSNESSSIRGVHSCTGGLRVVGIESESDSEVDFNSGVHDDQLGDSDIPLFWDCLGFEDQRVTNEELEWEEVDGRIDDREGMSAVIDRIEGLSVSSETSIDEEIGIGEEAVRNLEWEVLLAVNNLDRISELEHDGDGGVTYLDVHDDYTFTAEYDTLFGQFLQNESALKGSPPAAKSVVENLPAVVLTKEELKEDNVVCAVCKDAILAEEKVTRLPCQHHYHGDCIVPWLSIRNTCPVCRYELPTDDPDYEQRKTRRDSIGLLQDMQVRFNFELLP